MIDYTKQQKKIVAQDNPLKEKKPKLLLGLILISPVVAAGFYLFFLKTRK